MKDRLAPLLSSYRFRLALGSVTIVAVLAAGWAWSLYAPLTATVAEQQRIHLRAIALTAASVVEESDSPMADVTSKIAEDTGLRTTVVASNGAVLADSQEAASGMANHAGRPEIRAALAGRTGYDTRLSATQGTEQLYVAVPATHLGAHVALRVSEPLANVEAAAAGARRTGLLLLAISLAIAVAVVFRVSGATAAPILRLKQAAERMAEGDLTVPVPRVDGELAGLGDALAELGDRVRTTIGALEGEQAALRTALDGLEDAVFLLEGETILFANTAAGRLFKTPAVGWRGSLLAASGLPASLCAATAEMLASPKRSVRDLGPDPRGRYQRVTVVPLNDTDRGHRSLLVVEDSTDRERLDAMRRDFITNVSHELKTPTASIQLLADAASAAADSGDEVQALAFASQMSGEAERLRRMVLDLLDLSRLEAERALGAMTDMREAVGLTLSAHRAAANAAGLELLYDDSGAAAVDVFAAADPTDMAIALDNVLANAIAYTESGSVTVALETDRRSVAVRVTDTGIGIAPEHLTRVFERFYRVDPARSRDTGGTGLGLSLVRHAVERSGGHVTMESRPGSGTTVTIRVPRVR